MAQNGLIDSSPPLTSPALVSPEETLNQTKSPQNNKSRPDNTIAITREGKSAKLQEVTGQILEFLSNATNETLGACIVALGAITYLVLGRVGLVLIGVVGGVVLHATWEENNHTQTNESIRESEKRIRRERGLDVITRILDWRNGEQSRGSASENVQGQEPALLFSRNLDFSEFQPATSAALTSLTDAVIRDYVK